MILEPEDETQEDAYTLLDFAELRKDPDRMRAAIKELRDQAARLILIADTYELDMAYGEQTNT
jgi:hypothetical protein